MDARTYQSVALKTMADQQKILDRLVGLGPLAMQLDNGARGLADDAGEVSGVIKKHIEYGQPLDVTHLMEELGDCFWRIAQICDAAGITFEEIWEANYLKLNKVRYKDGYSDEAAKEENRDRAAERVVMERTDGGCTPIAPTPDCDVCEGTGQAGGKDASFSSPPCPKCYPANVSPKLPHNWDKDPYTQTGAGWAEPAEEHELSSTVRVSIEDGKAKLENSVVVKKELGHSYTRYCSKCKIQPIHKTNTLGICTPCFMKHGEPKED